MYPCHLLDHDAIVDDLILSPHGALDMSSESHSCEDIQPCFVRMRTSFVHLSLARCTNRTTAYLRSMVTRAWQFCTHPKGQGVQYYYT